MDSFPLGVIETERRGDVVVLRLIGEHDSTNKEHLAEAIDHHAHEAAGVVVSLADTRFIDSAVVHVLFDADGELRQRGKQLVLHLATDSVVRRVVELTQLSSAVTTTGSLEHAFVLAARGEKG